MKNYSTEAYYAYARRIVEGESGQANLPNKSDDGQFKKMIIGAGTGAVGAVACLKYLDTTFSIKSLNDSIINLRGYASKVSHWSAEAAKNGGKGMPSILQKVLGFFSGLVGKALIWVRNFCNSILKGFPGLSKPIFNGSGNFAAPTYGSVLCMALVGAAVGAVIYRIYKFIKNRRKKTESVAAFNARKNREYKAILVETVAFFDNLDRLTEASPEVLKQLAADDASIGTSLGNTSGGFVPSGSSARRVAKITSTPMGNGMEYVTKYDQYGKPMSSRAMKVASKTGGAGTTTATTAAKEAPAKAEGFLASMKERLTTMWTSVKTWCTNNPMLATMVGICAALVACWYGVKKYKESQAKKAGAAQTA